MKIFLICLKLDVPEVEEDEIELPKETLDRRENVEIWKSKNVTEAIGNIKRCNVIIMLLDSAQQLHGVALCPEGSLGVLR